jgi:hypothetical protein
MSLTKTGWNFVVPPSISGRTGLLLRGPLRNRWFADSPREGDEFEPPVPRQSAEASRLRLGCSKAASRRDSCHRHRRANQPKRPAAASAKLAGSGAAVAAATETSKFQPAPRSFGDPVKLILVLAATAVNVKSSKV